VTFARARDRALSGDADRLLYLEWSVEADSPDEVSSEVAGSREAWAESNPAFGIRITEDYLRAESRELAARTFAVERLGVGDWPATDGTGDQVIDVDLWVGLKEARSVLQDPVYLAFDVSPARTWSTIAAAGLNQDGILHLEVTDRREGTGWVAERVAELVEKNDAAGVVCDGVGPAASLVPDLVKLGVPVETVSGPELADACGLLLDLVNQRRLRHLGSSELLAAVKGVAKRTVGERWAWARRTSSVDITPLVAATLAVWQADTAGSGSFVLSFDDDEVAVA
jgi:hypothetical protein